MECSPSKWSGVVFGLPTTHLGIHTFKLCKSREPLFTNIYIYIYIRQCWGLKFGIEVQTKIFCTTKLLVPSVVPVCMGQVSSSVPGRDVIKLRLCLFHSVALYLTNLLSPATLVSLLLSPPSPSLPQDHCSGTCSHLSSEDDWLPISAQTHLLLPSPLLVFKGLHWSEQVARAKNKGVTDFDFIPVL